MTERPQIDSQ